MTVEEERGLWIDCVIAPVRALLMDEVQRRWADPRPAMRTFFGTADVPTPRSPHVDEKYVAFGNWVTSFRRPRRNSSTIAAQVLREFDLHPQLCEYLRARSQCAPSIWITRLASDDGMLTVENAFSGYVQRLLPMDPELAPAPGRGVPAQLLDFGRLTEVVPVGPVMDADVARRAVDHLRTFGEFDQLHVRGEQAHRFGHLFAWLAQQTDAVDAVGEPSRSRRGTAKRPRRAPAASRSSRSLLGRAKRVKGAPVLEEFLEFAVSLRGAKPSVRRRFVVRRTATLADLHDAIQDAFGWFDAHLWEFRPTGRGDAWGGAPEIVDDWGSSTPDARRVPITRHLARVGDRAAYVYDFGDRWEHTVELRGGVDDPGVRQRRLLDGRGACPPEDCGGLYGLDRLRQFRETGEDPWGELSSEEFDDWFGGWDPDAFDLEEFRARFDR